MSEPLKIALAQMTVGDNREANRAKAEQFIGDAAKEGASLIAFPEISFDPFFPQYPTEPKYYDWSETVPGATTERFASVARENKISVLLNLLQSVEPGQFFDSSAVLDHRGNLVGVTQMMHICETPGFHEKYYYWPGQTDYPVFDLAGIRVAPCICYDRHYPEVMRIFTLKGAQLIVVQTATTVEEAGQVLEAEMQAAALANGVYVALVNRVGVDGKLNFAGSSFVVAPGGAILARTKSKGDDILFADLDFGAMEQARVAWPFLRDRRPETYESLLHGLGPEE